MRFSTFLGVVAMLLCFTSAQKCLNQNNVAVDWYLMLILPNTTGTGYLYFDNTFTSSKFVYHPEEPDTATTPSFNTLTQINSMGLNFVAWNDELPNGTTSSSKAHSKSIIASSKSSGAGFVIIHSMPQYPAFIGNQVNISIGSSQQIYGQHFFCVTSTAAMISDLTGKTPMMKPYYYASTLASYPSYSSTSNFEYLNYTISGKAAKFIFKNGAINASIFEDGVNNMLKANLIAETWGRPIDAPWCGTYNTGNAYQITFSTAITWSQMADHSKWLVAMSGTYSCFGDMNRMSSQWVRGGAFYCLDNSLLNTALKNLITTPQTC